MAATPSSTAPTESLEIRVISAVNINPDKVADFEAYVKVEMRGQEGLVKARTGMGKWQPDGVVMKFDETMRLPIPIGAEEIRLKLCKDKKRGQSAEGGSNVISNAGIYLRDLLRFVPIEKEFGLFRPADKTAGGTIKIFFDYKPSTPAVPAAAAAEAPAVKRAAAPPAQDIAKTANKEVETPSKGYAYNSTPAQEVPAPVLAPATSVSQVTSHTTAASPGGGAKTRSATRAARDNSAKKGGFPIVKLLVLTVAAIGVKVGMDKRR